MLLEHREHFSTAIIGGAGIQVHLQSKVVLAAVTMFKMSTIVKKFIKLFFLISARKDPHETRSKYDSNS
jgi:hypothetical protein